MKDIKKAYELLEKKYKLPAFKILDKEFEISSIESTEFLMAKIRKKITDKLESFAKIIESLLQPDSSIIEITEAKNFSERDHVKLFDILKKLMYFIRSSQEIALFEDEKEIAEFIKDLMKEWQELKKTLKEIIKKTKEAWLKELEYESLSYLG